MPARPLQETAVIRGTSRVLFLRKEGEILQFLTTSADTRGTCSEIIFTLPAGQPAPRPHRHIRQTETVEVLAGTMKISMNGRSRNLGKGERLVIPPDTVHTFGNATKDSTLVVRVAFSPAANIEWYFTQMACSAIRNGGCWKQVPWLEAAIIHYALRHEYRLAHVPGWLQDLAFGTLTVFAKFTGSIRNIRPMSLHKAYVK
jgi:quercetin dioxygenase-like cupin family protein